MSMNVSGDVVRKLRTNRGWLQETLAEHSGLNVRTVQRVENDNVCDLETRSALALALGVPAIRLDAKQTIEQTNSESEGGPLNYQRLTSGQEVVDILIRADWYRYSNNDPRSEEDAKYVLNVLRTIEATANLWDDFSRAEEIQVASQLDELLRRMESKGFSLFGVLSRLTMSERTLDAAGRRVNIRVSNFRVEYVNGEPK